MRISPKFRALKAKVAYSLRNLMIFSFIKVRKIQTEIRIQAILCMNVNSMKKCQIFRNLLYLTVWRVRDLHFSVQVEWMCNFYDEINVLQCFHKFTDDDMWQLFAEQIYTPNNIWQQILIWNHDPQLEVGYKPDWNENPNWTSHS